jgi:hypothetical protein
MERQLESRKVLTKEVMSALRRASKLSVQTLAEMKGWSMEKKWESQLLENKQFQLVLIYD